VKKINRLVFKGETDQIHYLMEKVTLNERNFIEFPSYAFFPGLFFFKKVLKQVNSCQKKTFKKEENQVF